MAEPDTDWLKNIGEQIRKVSEDKRKMISRGLTRAKSTCPKCEVKNALQLSLAPSRRSGGALRWWCETEGCDFTGME